MPAQLPSGATLNVSPPLTDVAVGFQQSSSVFIADKVFPTIGVKLQAGQYYKLKRGDWFRGEAAVRAPATESAGGGWEVERDTFAAEVYALHKDLDDQDRANDDTPFNLDSQATIWVTTNLLMKRDRDFIAAYVTSGVWDTDLTGVAAAPGAGEFLRWDVAGSDPIMDILTYQLAVQAETSYKPNVLIMGPKVLLVLKNHESILERIKYTERGVGTVALLASLFDVERVLVTVAVENDGVQGAADDFGFMSDRNALLVYAASSPGINTPSGGYIFAWTGLLGSGATGIRMKKFRIEKIASDRVEGEMAYDMKVVCPEVGVFFESCVAA